VPSQKRIGIALAKLGFKKWKRNGIIRYRDIRLKPGPYSPVLSQAWDARLSRVCDRSESALCDLKFFRLNDAQAERDRFGIANAGGRHRRCVAYLK
jgi:hypothetical protein